MKKLTNTILAAVASLMALTLAGSSLANSEVQETQYKSATGFVLAYDARSRQRPTRYYFRKKASRKQGHRRVRKPARQFVSKGRRGVSRIPAGAGGFKSTGRGPKPVTCCTNWNTAGEYSGCATFPGTSHSACPAYAPYSPDGTIP